MPDAEDLTVNSTKVLSSGSLKSPMRGLLGTEQGAVPGLCSSSRTWISFSTEAFIHKDMSALSLPAVEYFPLTADVVQDASRTFPSGYICACSKNGAHL